MNSGQKWRWALLVVILAMSASGIIAWRLWSSEEKEKTEATPSRVCQGRFSGKVIDRYLPGDSGQFAEDSDGFPKDRIVRSGSSCELSRGSEDLDIWVRYRFDVSRQSIREKGEPLAAWGEAYGYYHSSALLVFIPCPTEKSPERTLLLGVDSSLAQGNDSGKRIRELTEFSSYSGRILSREVFKCQGSEELPEGPVKLATKSGAD